MRRAGRHFEFCYSYGANATMLNAAFITDQCDYDQNEHYDQDDALFVLGEFDNSQQLFHLIRRYRPSR